MEINALSSSSIRIKGKSGSIITDSFKKVAANAILSLETNVQIPHDLEDQLLINGPGEYETGGLKISGIRDKAGIAYKIVVDNISIILGEIKSLKALQPKLSECHIVILKIDEVEDLAFVTHFAPRALLAYGEKAEEVLKGFAKENIQALSKYQTFFEKLPSEMEAILLKA